MKLIATIEPIILSSNISHHPQILGYGANLVNLTISIKVDALVKPEETRHFLVEVRLHIRSDTYQYTNIFSKESMNSEGYISIGSLYVIGPVNEDEITSTTTLTFVTIPS